VLYHILQLAANKEVHPQVHAIANQHLQDLKDSWTAAEGGIHKREMARQIDAFYAHPDQFKVPAAPKIPDGSPIGMECMF